MRGLRTLIISLFSLALLAGCSNVSDGSSDIEIPKGQGAITVNFGDDARYTTDVAKTLTSSYMLYVYNSSVKKSSEVTSGYSVVTDAGTYNIVVIADSDGSSSSVSAIASAYKEDVVVEEGKVTVVNLELIPFETSITASSDTVYADDELTITYTVNTHNPLLTCYTNSLQCISEANTSSYVTFKSQSNSDSDGVLTYSAIFSVSSTVPTEDENLIFWQNDSCLYAKISNTSFKFNFTVIHYYVDDTVYVTLSSQIPSNVTGITANISWNDDGSTELIAYNSSGYEIYYNNTLISINYQSKKQIYRNLFLRCNLTATTDYTIKGNFVTLTDSGYEKYIKYK